MKRCLACDARFASEGWTCERCGWAPVYEDGCPVFAPELRTGDGTDAEYLHDALRAAESRHFWFRSRLRIAVWALRRHFPGVRRLLEVGCGTGYMLEGLRRELPDLELTASDTLVSALRHARPRLPEVSWMQMDARRVPYRDEFDVVAAFDVVEHIEEDAAVLAELARAVRPGGGLILTVPQHPWLWATVDEFSHHKRRYTRRELVGKVRDAGLETVHVTSTFASILPLVALSRFRRVPLDEFDPTAELRIGALASGLLDGVMRIEEAVLHTGISLPAGGSLLLAARRPREVTS